MQPVYKKITTLDRMKIGEKAKVRRLLGNGNKRRRLAEMGITPNTDISVKRIAPLGDPIEISVRSYELSLRYEDARWIEITLE